MRQFIHTLIVKLFSKREKLYSRKAHYYEWVEKIMGLKNNEAVKI